MEQFNVRYLLLACILQEPPGCLVKEIPPHDTLIALGGTMGCSFLRFIKDPQLRAVGHERHLTKSVSLAAMGSLEQLKQRLKELPEHRAGM